MAAQAQPEARRQQQQAQAAKKSNANNMTTRAQISFPTEAKMAEDVVWRRDVYRELDLNDDANAGLYYPTEPVGTQMNLFTYLFKLIMAGPRHGGIAAYSYDVNSGNERFDESLRIQPLKFLDDYHIFYERAIAAFILTIAIFPLPRSRAISSRRALTSTRCRPPSTPRCKPSAL